MNNEFQVAAVIPAAGRGQRMKADTNKVWLPINGQTILFHTLQAFQKVSVIEKIVLVVKAEEIKAFRRFLDQNEAQLCLDISLVIGGTERQFSVENGLKFLQTWPGWRSARRLIVIHDAARALVTPDLLQESINACLEFHAVGVGVPVKDTIKQVDQDRYVQETPERSSLWAIQTPQVFDFDLVLKCYERVSGLPKSFSDDCGIVEYCGNRVKLIMGSYENFKITTPEDLVLAEAVLRRRTDANRTGI